MVMLQKFGKVLGVALAGLLSLLLVVFFVSVFFTSRGSSYPTGSVNRLGGVMMEKAPQAAGTPTMMANPLSFGGVAADRSVAQGNVEGAMESVSVPTMMPAEKKIIRNGDLNLRVRNVDQALTRIGSIVADLGGEIADSHFNQAVSGSKSGTVTVKVPVDKFDEAFSRLKEVATIVLSESMSGADVTEQYIDLQARINNKKAAEATLQTLFERAVKMSDVIEVTDKLAQVRGEIESLEGQLRYLNAQTDMASVVLSLTEDTTVVADQGFRPLQTLKESMMMLIRLSGDFTEGLIRLLVVVLPIVLMYGLIFWVIYRLVRGMVMKLWPGNRDEKRG